jgi:tetratricopeptide (TPR) repeat protein
MIKHYYIVFLLLTLIFQGVKAQDLAQSPVPAEEMTRLQKVFEQAKVWEKENEVLAALRNYLEVQNQLLKYRHTQLLASSYAHIGDIYRKENLLEKAIEYYTKAEEVIIKGNWQNTELQFTTLLDMADSFRLKKSYNSALKEYEKVLEILKGQRNYTKIIETLEKMVICHHETGDFAKAIELQENILTFTRALGDSSAVVSVLNNIGYEYKYQKNYPKSFSFFSQSLLLSQKLGERGMKIKPNLVNMGIMFQYIGNYQESLEYLHKALKITQLEGTANEKAEIFDLISSVYLKRGDFYNAEVYNDSAIQASENHYYPQILQSAYLTKSQIYQAGEDFQNGLTYYKKHLNIRDSLLVEERLRQQAILQQQFVIERSEKEIQLLLADEEVKAQEAQKQTLELENKEKALAILQRDAELKNAEFRRQALEKERAEQNLLLIRKQLESEKSAKEIALLKQNEEIQRLTLAQKEAEEKERLQQIQLLREQKNALEKEKELEELAQEARRHYIIGGGSLLGIIILLISIGLIITQRKNKVLAFQRKELSEQKEEIQQQNEELTQNQEEISSQRDALMVTNNRLNHAYDQIKSSINYAKRIQSAMLPTMPEIQTFLPNFFVFFKPRDIVSGDFYWFAELEGMQIITAADCTGHGVPGAFMSLIGNDLLNEIVKIRKITFPSEILSELNKGIRQTLRQEENDVKDGMDIALCTIERARNMVLYAGAKNPLIYVKQNEEGVVEAVQVKADVQPIGGRAFYEKETFVTHEIKVEAHQKINFYLFSDGFQDQFGGEKCKKYMIKRFREFLANSYNVEISKQEKLFEKEFIDWKGTEEQIDDVLVLGFSL